MLQGQLNLWHLYDLGRVFDGLSILDVGCGGGLVSEPLANLGATVTGIDASALSIRVARQHAHNTTTPVNYEHAMASDLLADGRLFDVVINAEVVEHVQNQSLLIEQCAQLVKPGGILILATLNRTIKSFVIAIVGAEYVMNYLPKGTHSWHKFVKPSELSGWAEQAGCELLEQTGMQYNLFKQVAPNAADASELCTGIQKRIKEKTSEALRHIPPQHHVGSECLLQKKGSPSQSNKLISWLVKTYLMRCEPKTLWVKFLFLNP